MAFPNRAGAGMFVIGKDCDAVLATWLKDTQNATPAGKSQGHLAAGTVAVGPKALQQLAQPGFEPMKLLGLSANRAPTKVIVKRQGDGGAQNYIIKLERQRGSGGGHANATP